jgi:hypothetical protein
MVGFRVGEADGRCIHCGSANETMYARPHEPECEKAVIDVTCGCCRDYKADHDFGSRGRAGKAIVAQALLDTSLDTRAFEARCCSPQSEKVPVYSTFEVGVTEIEPVTSRV